MKKTFKTLVFSAVLAAVSGFVFADAAKLELHKDSHSATIDVKADIPEMVAITTPSAMQEMQFSGKDDLSATSYFCIASNIGENVQLSIANSQAGDDFTMLKDGESTANEHSSIPFSVSYKSTNGTATPIKKDTKTQVDGAKWLADCSQSQQTGSSITVKVDEANAQRVFAGKYNSVLTLTVTPK